jgi:hypothetical protein
MDSNSSKPRFPRSRIIWFLSVCFNDLAGGNLVRLRDLEPLLESCLHARLADHFSGADFALRCHDDFGRGATQTSGCGWAIEFPQSGSVS